MRITNNKMVETNEGGKIKRETEVTRFILSGFYTVNFVLKIYVYFETYHKQDVQCTFISPIRCWMSRSPSGGRAD